MHRKAVVRARNRCGNGQAEQKFFAGHTESLTHKTQTTGKSKSDIKVLFSFCLFNNRNKAMVKCSVVLILNSSIYHLFLPTTIFNCFSLSRPGQIQF